MAHHTEVPAAPAFWQQRVGETRLSPQAHILTVLRLAVGVLFGLGCMWLAASMAQAIVAAISAQQTTTAPVVAPFGNGSVAGATQHVVSVAVGGTQSYTDTAITMTNLRIVTSQGAIGAPSGQAFAIVSVTLRNLDPAHSQAFNVADFVLQNAGEVPHHAAFTALDDPLAVGTLAPNGSITGDLAFLVTYPVADTAPDPQIVYLPSGNSGATLGWSVPLAPLLP